MPCASRFADIPLYSGFIVLMEDTTVSLGDVKSLARSFVVSTSSPSFPLRVRSIPHTGHSRGLSEITVGCIGHVYRSRLALSLLREQATTNNINATMINSSPLQTVDSGLWTVDFILSLQLFFIAHNHSVIFFKLIKVFYLRHV